MKLNGVNWTNVIFLASYHALFLVMLPLYLLVATPSLGLLAATIALIFVCGIAISAGYHRFYSHRTYRANKGVETILLFLGTLNIQNDVLTWSHDHRLHHRFVDTEKDPYSINKGFWHAHFIWMLEKPGPLDTSVVHDLTKNRLVMFQHKYYLALAVLTNVLVVVFFGWLFNDYLGAFVFMFLTRLFVNHHTTWFINSLAHYWGAQPYSREHTAVNNWIISLLTYGEGYHNYHHTFASDYRNGVRWYQFDPTKLLIWGMGKLGLAHGLKRVDRSLITKRLIVEDKKLLLERVKNVKYLNWELLEREISTLADSLSKKLSEISALAHDYKRLKMDRKNAKPLKLKIKRLKKAIRAEFRSWGRLCDTVLTLKPQLT